jgi:branched-chain amino acid transport system substrate-binding protein
MLRRVATVGFRVCFLAAGVVLFLSAVAQSAAPTEPRLRLYIDADFTHSPAVAQGIDLGIRAALHLHGAQERFVVIPRDHRANARRSLDTMTIAAGDGQALAVFGGMDSVPYLTFNLELNALRIPILLPWSAGRDITRGTVGGENWFFRVSVDDSKTGAYLASQAVRRGCRRPGMVAVDNPWGTGNLREMQRQLMRQGTRPVGSWRLETGAGPSQAARIVQLLGAARVDCLLLFGESASSIAIIRKLAFLKRPPLVLSHWGLFGHPDLGQELRVPLGHVDLRILGSCGLERMSAVSALAQRAEASASAVREAPVSLAGLQAPHAFFHAFDATTLLLAAVESAAQEPDWHQDPLARRIAVRRALYALETPVEGLLATYRSPFTPVGPETVDGHEALGADDLCMQRIDAIGRLRPSRIAAPDARAGAQR